MEIKLQTLVGRNVATGEPKEWDLDEVLVDGNRVALVPHVEGAHIRLVRILTPAQEKELHSAVTKQRQEQGKPGVSGFSRLPDPEELKAALKKKKASAP